MEGAKTMEYLLSTLLTSLESISFVLFFDTFFERRCRGRRFWGLWLLCTMILVITVVSLHVQISILKILFSCTEFLLINLLLYSGKFVLRIAVTVLGYALMYLWGLFWNFVPTLLLGIPYEIYSNSRILYTVFAVSCNLILVFLGGLLKHFRKRRKFPNSQWTFLTLFLPIFTLATLLPLTRLLQNDRQSLVLTFCVVTVLVIANIGVLILLDLLGQAEASHEQALAMNERLRAQEKNIDALGAAYSSQRKMTHDFQHHLDVLSNLMENGENHQALEYLHNLQAHQNKRILLVNAHHAAIDAVLNQKAYEAKKREIDIQFEVNDLSPLKINSVDCTTVLANLLDNAIEACMKLEPDKRWIEVKVLHLGNSLQGDSALFVSVLNATLPVKIVHGEIETTKSDARLHGFGLSNVKELLTRNNADYIMNYMDGTFQFSLEWPDNAR